MVSDAKKKKAASKKAGNKARVVEADTGSMPRQDRRRASPA